MEEKLHEELAELEKNLSNLKGYVEYIEQAKENSKKISEAAETVVEKLKNIQEEYGILKSAVDKLLKKIDEIDFPERLTNIDKEIKNANTNISSAHDSVKQIYHLLKPINFPLRFDKLDRALSTNELLIKKSASDVSAKIDVKTNTIISTINEAYNELNTKISSVNKTLFEQSKQVNFNKNFSVVSFVIVIIMLAVVIYKIFILG